MGFFFCLLFFCFFVWFLFFFFFQAEDGIRDRNVTGVQTCALPIYKWAMAIISSIGLIVPVELAMCAMLTIFVREDIFSLNSSKEISPLSVMETTFKKIGRASCRERV